MNALYRQSVPALILQLLLAASTYAIDADWLSAVSATWDDATKWSTSPSWPNGIQYNVAINAAGTPYTITLPQTSLTVNSVSIDSPDANLVMGMGTTFSVPGDLHVERGALNLNGGILSNTRLSAATTGTMQLGSTATTLNNLTLAGKLQAQTNVAITGTLTLDGGTLYAANGTINGSIKGNGEWVLSSTTSCNNGCTLHYTSSPPMEIGAGVTVRSAGRRVYMYATSSLPSSVLVNRGTLCAETPGGYMYIERLTNEGLIRVSTGDEIAAGFYNNVGALQLGPGGTLTMYGTPNFNLPTTIDGSTLNLAATSVTTVQPIHLASGYIVLSNPASGVPIASTGGSVSINTTVTPAQLAAMPISGPAIVSLSGPVYPNGGTLDLAGGTYDYTSNGYNWSFVNGIIRNGTFTGPNVSLSIGGAPGFNNLFRFDTTQIDVPLRVTGTTELRNTSALLKPVVVDGGTLTLYNAWTNTGGIQVNSGTLNLASKPADFGNINFTAGELRLGFNTTLTDALALPFGTPDRVFMQSSTGTSVALDLQAATLDLDSSRFAWGVGTSGRITNGNITGTLAGRTLAMRSGQLLNVSIDSTHLTGGGSLSSVIGNNLWIDTASATNTTLTNSRVNYSISPIRGSAAPGLTVLGNLELNGSLQGPGPAGTSTVADVLFTVGSTLSGTGQIGNTDGRIQGTIVGIQAADFTIPSGITLISATPYDSTDLVEAPTTNLNVAGRILSGYTSQFGGKITDSWTFHVASLRTTGQVDITNDGKVVVQGGPWHHAGNLSITGGQITADSIDIEPTGTFTGAGTIELGSAGLNVSGILAPGTTTGQLAVHGDATFNPSATLQIELRGTNNSNPAAPQFDQLQISGAANLAGALEVTLSASFHPAATNAFDILNWTALNGTFTAIELPTLTAGLAWNTTQLYATGILSIFATTLPGDFNGDHVVDAADYTYWRKYDGTAEDYDLWRQHFGETLTGSGSSLPGSSPVPEPLPLAFVSSAIAIFSSLRRSRHRDAHI